MRRTTRRIAQIVVAAAMLTLAAPMTAARADFGDTLKGGCGLTTYNNATLIGGVNSGVIYNVSLSQEQNGTPSTADVECWVEVNGLMDIGTYIFTTGLGVQAGAKVTGFVAASSDAIAVCQRVTFHDGSTWVAPDGNTGTDCTAVTEAQVPPQQVIDLIDTIVDVTDSIDKGNVDPIVCPIFVSLHGVTGGGVLGVLLIDAQGDLYVAQPLGVGYHKVYDCPPYDADGGGSVIPVSPTIVIVKLPPTI